MSRTLTAATESAAIQPIARPVVLAHIDFASGDVYVNSSDRNIAWGGNTYLGVGRLASVSAIEETATVQATGLQLGLSGIPAEYITLVLQEPYQGRTVELWLGLIDDSYALIASPTLCFSGLADQMKLTLGATGTVTLTAENRLIRWEVPNVRRYTDADQQERFPGDLGCQFVPQAVERKIAWGRNQ